jgi:3-hydroxyisobutyrate dehydrogenase/glyoxylate/succinic semialdehyde reductase
MAEGRYEPATMKVSTWKKDMEIIAEFAEEVGCLVPLFALTQPVYSRALSMGFGDRDTAAVFEVLKQTILRPPGGQIATVDRSLAGDAALQRPKRPDGE